VRWRSDDLDIRLGGPGKPPPARKPPEMSRRGNSRAILVTAIIGLIGCPFMGLVAWAWGRRELARIQGGVVDPVQEGRVRAAMIIGIVGVIYNAIMMLLLGSALAFGLRTLYDAMNSVLGPGAHGSP